MHPFSSVSGQHPAAALGPAKLRKLQSLVSLQRHTNTPAVDKEKQRPAFQVFDLLHVRSAPQRVQINVRILNPADVLKGQLLQNDLQGLGVLALAAKLDILGDILTDSTIGYVFLLKRVGEDVRENLVKVRHTSVEGKILPPHSCPFVFQFEDRTVYLSHNRIDAVIKEAFDLSRRDSQEKIGKEEVFVDGHVVRDNSFRLKPGVRVSVRGKGKFLYVGDERKTKKDRIVTTIRLYR